MNNKETKAKLKKHVLDLFSLETMRNDMYEIFKRVARERKRREIEPLLKVFDHITAKFKNYFPFRI